MQTRRRILYVQPNNEVGGSDIALLRTIEQLDRERYEPLVALPNDGPLSALLRKAGADLHFVPMQQLRTLPSLSYQARYMGAFIPTVRRLARLIRDREVSLVHTNSLYCLYGAWAARLAGCAHLWHLREIPPEVPVLRPLYAKMVLGLSSTVVAMTGACVEGLFGTLGASSKIVVMPDGIDTDHWNPTISGSRIRTELNLAPEVPVIGFCARLDPWKGLDVFLHAAQRVSARVPEARFLIIGDAPSGFEAHRDAMMALSNSLGLSDRVHFLGWRYRLADIPEVMAALTVLCHTPIQPEPFGLVVIEAMAVGCPVVAPRAGGPAETVADGETGFLVPMGDAEAFADRLCRLVLDKDLRMSMSIAARERVVDRYSSERFAGRLADVYARALTY